MAMLAQATGRKVDHLHQSGVMSLKVAGKGASWTRTEEKFKMKECEITWGRAATVTWSIVWRWMSYNFMAGVRLIFRFYSYIRVRDVPSPLNSRASKSSDLNDS